MQQLLHAYCTQYGSYYIFPSLTIPGLYLSVHSHYSKMTMEVILATAFGRTLDIQNGRGGELYESAKLMFAYLESNSGPLARLMFLIESV